MSYRTKLISETDPRMVPWWQQWPAFALLPSSGTAMTDTDGCIRLSAYPQHRIEFVEIDIQNYALTYRWFNMGNSYESGLHVGIDSMDLLERELERKAVMRDHLAPARTSSAQTNCGAWIVATPAEVDGVPTIRMWRRRQPEPLLVLNDARVSVVADGRWYTIDLLNKRAIEGLHDAGDIQCAMRLMPSPSGSQEAKLDIRFPNGGAVTPTALEDWEAPINGYSSSLTPTGSDQHLVIVSRDSRVYGSIYLRYFLSHYQKQHHSPTGYIWWHGTFNPGASPNLVPTSANCYSSYRSWLERHQVEKGIVSVNGRRLEIPDAEWTAAFTEWERE